MLSVCADDTLAAFSYNGTAYTSPFLQQAPTPAVTSTGIALASGSYVGTSVDLASDFLGMGWGHTRSWSNTAGLGPNGNHWVVSQMPYLVLDNNANSTLIAVDGGVSQRWFDWSNSTWTARMYIQDTLVANTESEEYVLTDPAGNRMLFHDFSVSEAAKRGKFKGCVDAFGNAVTTTYDASGRLTETVRTTATAGTSYKESYSYAYSGSLLTRVALRRKQWTDGSEPDWANAHVIRYADYAYYEASDPNGTPNDLKTVFVRDNGGALLDASYYRYYTGASNPGYLKYVVSPSTYPRMGGAGLDPTTVSDATLAGYADHYFEYDTQNRVVKHTAQGLGSSSNEGFGTEKIEYNLNASSDPNSSTIDTNVWRLKAVHYVPDSTPDNWTDNNYTTVFMNEVGQPMLQVQTERSTSQVLRTFCKHDAQGRVVLTASPAAVTGYSESYQDLLGLSNGNYTFLNDATGMVQETDYYMATTATSGVAGGVTGMKQADYLRLGETGTRIKQSDVSYYRFTSGTVSINLVAEQKVYRNTDGTGDQTVSFAYTLYPGTLQPKTIGTTLPAVTVAQNGSGAATTTAVVLDAFGRTTWTRDAGGVINMTAYDPATGAVVKSIVDVVYASLDPDYGEPAAFDDTGWTQPTDSVLHLVTALEVDKLGRTTKVTDAENTSLTDPQQRTSTYIIYKDDYWSSEVRTYAGWLNGTQLGPTAVTRIDRARGYSETLTMSATPATANGLPTGTEAISNLHSLARAYTNRSGQGTHEDAYFSLAGVTYDIAVNLGVLNTNYYRTLYGYNDRGLGDRAVTPTGTITRSVYDGFGREKSSWVGTSDSGWTPASASHPNMVLVLANEYDGSGNLLSRRQVVGGTLSDRVTLMYYDWRNRLVATKQGHQGPTEDGSVNRPIMYTDYDNLGQALASLQYDGDGVTLSMDSNGTVVKPSASLLRAKATADYDVLGRVYASHLFSVDPASGAVSAYSLNTWTWRDSRGNIIKTLEPGGAVTKTEYDRASRPTKVSCTDGGGDAAPGATGNWASAADVMDDVVLAQRETTYDKNSRPIFLVSRERFHDETATGALGNSSTQPKARVSYSATYYDGIGRETNNIDVGANGGSVYVRPATPPSGSATVLRTFCNYFSPCVTVVMAPDGTQTCTTTDNLGRNIQFIENYDPSFNGGHPGASIPSKNRTTAYAYDGSNHMVRHTAVLPVGPDADGAEDHQITQYVYGVGRDGTLDSSFSDDGKLVTNLGGYERGRAVRVQSDGKIVVAGYTDESGTSDFVVLRYNRDGSLDNSFGNSGKAVIDFGGADDRALAVDIDSLQRILVAGRTKTTNGTWDIGVARLTANGVADSTFGSFGKAITNLTDTDVAQAIRVLSDGRILVVGFTNSGGSNNNDFVIARYADNGAFDSSFGTNGFTITDFGGGSQDYAYALDVQSDGKIVVAGMANGNLGIARYTAAGQADTSFCSTGRQSVDLGGTDAARTLLIQPDGKYVLGGDALAGGRNFVLVRLTATGQLDSSFGSGGIVLTDSGQAEDYGQSVVIEPDGRLVLGGYAGDDFFAARYLITGALDLTFGTNGTGMVITDIGAASADTCYVLLRQHDGKLVAAGSTNGEADIAVVRYHDAGSTVFSNDLLAKTAYPDSGTGLPSEQDRDHESWAYNAAGEVLYAWDRNGSVHGYGYDMAGRKIFDVAWLLGVNVTGTVRRLGYNYDSAGRPYQSTSYSDVSASSVYNQIQYAYNGLGQLTAEYQSFSGAVNTASTPKVSYAYSEMAGGANHSRLKSMTYPSPSRSMRYEYSTGIDDRISRVSYLIDDWSGSLGATLEIYSYLGLGTIVQAYRPQPVTMLTYLKQSGDPAMDTEDSRFAGDQYTGLDRFGRVIDQRWMKGSTSFDRYEYTYDLSGNIATKDALGGGADEAYGYDGLRRLTGMARGTLSDRTIIYPTGAESWQLDATGNPLSRTSGGSTVSTTGTYNQQNQTLSAGGTATPLYDANGNMTRDERGNIHEYDAWNRLMRVWTGGGALIAAYCYDASGRRNGEGDRAIYYAGQQVVEERSYVTGTVQYAWGLAAGGGLIERDEFNTSGVWQRRLFAQQDAGRSVTSLTDLSGTAVERYRYWSYGALIWMNGSWGVTGASAVGWLHLFQGGRLSVAAGLYRFGARDYSPSLERWTSMDPAGYIDGANLYGFTRNNPITFIDPTGLTAYTIGPSDGPRQDLADALKAVLVVNDDGTTFNRSMSLPTTIGSGDQWTFQNVVFSVENGYAFSTSMLHNSELNVLGSEFIGGGLEINVSEAVKKGQTGVRLNISGNEAHHLRVNPRTQGDAAHWLLISGSSDAYGNAPRRAIISANVSGNTIRGATGFADIINLYSVQGTKGDRINIANNTIAAKTLRSGGGIITDLATSWTVIKDNTVRGARFGFGVQIGSGSHNMALRNTAIGCGTGIFGKNQATADPNYVDFASKAKFASLLAYKDNLFRENTAVGNDADFLLEHAQAINKGRNRFYLGTIPEYDAGVNYHDGVSLWRTFRFRSL